MNTTRQNILTSASILVLTFGLGLPPSGSAAPALDISSSPTAPAEPPPDLVFGWQFSLAQPIQISHFGLFDAGLDGFERDYKVKIWSVSGPFTPIAAEGFTAPGSSLLGSFRYVQVTDVFLSPGEYIIAAGTGR